MTTEFRIQDTHYGEVNVFAIRVQEDGTWEKEWEPLRQGGPEEIIDLLSPISWAAWTELLHRFARPFFKEAGLGPKGCLQKIPEITGQCFYKETCPSHNPKICKGISVSRPPCFDANIDNSEIRVLVSRLIDWWHLDFYVVLVLPENVI